MRFEVPAQCTLHFVRVCGLVPGTAWVHAFSKCAHTVVALRPHRIIVPEMKTALISLGNDDPGNDRGGRPAPRKTISDR